MTEHDTLEAELAALRPREPSAELRQRIATLLASPSSVRRARQRVSVLWSGALAGGLAAACFAALVLWRGEEREIEAETPAARFEPVAATAFDEALPSIWSYRSALTRSPEGLDDLLDKHGARTLRPERARAFVFARFDSELNARFGEL